MSVLGLAGDLISGQADVVDAYLEHLAVLVAAGERPDLPDVGYDGLVGLALEWRRT